MKMALQTTKDKSREHASFLLQKLFARLWNCGLLQDFGSGPFPEKNFIKQLKIKSLVCMPRWLQAYHNDLRYVLEKEEHLSVNFQTVDGLQLDGMLFHHNRPKVVLFIPGLGSFYESIATQGSIMQRFYEFFSLALPSCALFVFNNRGIGNSQGAFDLKNLPLDTYSAYLFLTTKQRYRPEDIFIYTHSLGGLHGIQGAQLFQKKYPTATLCAISDRSLGSLSRFTKAFLNHTPFANLAASMISKLGLNLSAKQAWLDLKGEKMIIVSKQDRIIPYDQGSFYHFMQSDIPRDSVLHLEEECFVENHHTRLFTEKETKHIVDFIHRSLSLN